MAGINCPQCGTEIRSYTPSCPSCGTSFEHPPHESDSPDHMNAALEEARKKLRLHTVASILVTLAGAVVLVAEANLSQDADDTVLTLALFAVGLGLFMGGIAWSYITRVRKALLEKKRS